VNPDPDVSSDPEIDILKQMFDSDDAPSPSSPSTGGKFPDDSSAEFFDEEQSIGGSQESFHQENGREDKDARKRHLIKKERDNGDKKLYKKHKSLIAQAGLKSTKKA